MEKINDIARVMVVMGLSITFSVGTVFAFNGGHLPRPKHPVIVFSEITLSVDDDILSDILNK